MGPEPLARLGRRAGSPNGSFVAVLKAPTGVPPMAIVEPSALPPSSRGALGARTALWASRARWRQRGFHGAIAAAGVVLAATLVACYSLWAAEGCVAFLPFVSDLGLQGWMRGIFCAGMVLEALTLALALPQVVLARGRLLAATNQGPAWQRFNGLLAAAGAVVVLGVALLGFFPWDRALLPHILCADAIFFGGTFWSLGGAAVAKRVRCAAEPLLGSTQPPANRLQVRLAGCSFVALSVMFACLSAAHMSDPEHFVMSEVLGIARDDFHGYCTAQRSWHRMGWVNTAALAEWLLVGSLLAGVIAARDEVDLSLKVRGQCEAARPERA